MSPLEWWPSKGRALFKRLWVVFLGVDAFPPAQNDVERLFSTATYLSGVRRSSMGVEMLAELCFINKNYPDRLDAEKQFEPELSLEEIAVIKAGWKAAFGAD